jgi:hypothetical protein
MSGMTEEKRCLEVPAPGTNIEALNRWMLESRRVIRDSICTKVNLPAPVPEP